MDEVKNIMVENIEQIMQRGDKIEVLVDKTDDLRNQVKRSRDLFMFSTLWF